ncbi:MAG: OB-fold nucleic acid binding domain-containing protein [Promethearchaeota archaeon]
MKVSELTSSSRRVDIKLRILSIETPRDVRTSRGSARVATATAGDETGTIKLSLWNDDIDLVSEDSVIQITNGYVKTFQGEKQLSSGIYGELVVVDDPMFPSREAIMSGTAEED